MPAGLPSSRTCSASRCWTVSSRVSWRLVVGQVAPELDLVLVSPGMIDGDRRMAGEGGQEVGEPGGKCAGGRARGR